MRRCGNDEVSNCSGIMREWQRGGLGGFLEPLGEVVVGEIVVFVVMT